MSSKPLHDRILTNHIRIRVAATRVPARCLLGTHPWYSWDKTVPDTRR